MKCPNCNGDGSVEFYHEDLMGQQHETYDDCPICGGWEELDKEELEALGWDLTNIDCDDEEEKE